MQSYSNTSGIPSVSVTSSYKKLSEHITTRVMASKIIKQKEQEVGIFGSREKSLGTSANGKPLTERARRPSQFLLGTSIPNSIIKSKLQRSATVKEIEDRATARAKRDASVKEIIERLEFRRLLSNVDITTKDGENMTCTVSIDESTKHLDNKKNELITTSALSQDSNGNVDQCLDALKAQRRIRRRTTLLSPVVYKISCQRKPTYEAIKHSIQNINTIQGVVDVNGGRNGKLNRFDRRISPSRTCSRVPCSVPIADSTRINSLATPLKFDSLYKLSSNTSKMSRKSITSPANMKKGRLPNDSRKAILTQGYRLNFKPLRNASNMENNKKENSQTQTYLRMKDFA